jgi:hypothetical protein
MKGKKIEHLGMSYKEFFLLNRLLSLIDLVLANKMDGVVLLGTTSGDIPMPSYEFAALLQENIGCIYFFFLLFVIFIV